MRHRRARPPDPASQRRVHAGLGRVPRRHAGALGPPRPRSAPPPVPVNRATRSQENASQALKERGVTNTKKVLGKRRAMWYSVFAFVALVSPLGCKAVARSHLRPIFLFCGPLCGPAGRGLKTAAALLRGSGLEASDSLMLCGRSAARKRVKQ